MEGVRAAGTAFTGERGTPISRQKRRRADARRQTGRQAWWPREAKDQAPLIPTRSPRTAQSPVQEIGRHAPGLCELLQTSLPQGFATMWRVNQRGSAHTMPKPKPLTTFGETMIRAHYGRRTLPWIGARLGCSPATVVTYAKQLGLWQPIADETGGAATAPAVVCSDATDSFIPPPTREQLMAGSANPRRVYKIED